MYLTKPRITREYLRASLRLRTWKECGFKLAAEIDPFRVLWIDPNQITSSSKPNVPKGGHFYCRILDGDWDLADNRFEDRSSCGMLKQHFVDGIPWLDTSYYQTLLKKIGENGSYWNDCCSEGDVQARCAYLDQLYTSIKNTGYRIPEGLKYGESGITTGSVPLEIAVNIGRDGRFLFWDGRHRLMIAKILELPLIPVRVVVRHKLWQDLREKIIVGNRKNNLSEQLHMLTSHPDISYLLS
jgi:hypothetical protein